MRPMPEVISPGTVTIARSSTRAVVSGTAVGKVPPVSGTDWIFTPCGPAPAGSR